MKFGGVTDLSTVDFSLNSHDEVNKAILEQFSSKNKKCRVYVGATGWTTKEWKGSYYPSKLASDKMLNHYGSQFNSIELNTTAYRTPKPDLIERWRSKVPDDFRFCPKVVQWVSHSNTLGTENGDIERLIEAYQLFGDNYGSAFLQLSPRFDRTKSKILERFLDIFPDNLQLSVELRHPSWFEDQALQEDTQMMFASFNKSWLITDVAGRRDVAHMRLTTDYVVIRWVGNGLVDTDYTRIDHWVDTILRWKEYGMREIYFFTHEPDNILTPEIAAYFCSRFEHCSDIEIRGPQKLSLF